MLPDFSKFDEGKHFRDIPDEEKAAETDDRLNRVEKEIHRTGKKALKVMKRTGKKLAKEFIKAGDEAGKALVEIADIADELLDFMDRK